MIPPDEARRTGTGDQYGADEEVAARQNCADVSLRRIERRDGTPEDVVDVGQPAGVHIQHRDVGTESCRHLGRVHADDAATQNSDLAAGDAGNTPQQYTASAGGPLQVFRPFLDTQAASDFTHGLETGESAIIAADGFIGDADDLAFKQRLRQLLVSGKVEIGKKGSVLHGTGCTRPVGVP